MKKYWYIFKLSWSELLTYRLNITLEIIGTLILMTFTIILWQAIFRLNGINTLGGYTLKEITTYLIGASGLAIIIFRRSQGDEINDDINRGSLSQLLMKPFSPSFFWFIKDISRRLWQIIIAVIALILLSTVFHTNLSLELTYINLYFFLILLGGAIILHFLIFYTFSIIAFWLEQTWGERFVINVIMDIAAGLLIPLNLFPIIWQKIFDWLPFKFMVYVPLQIIMGKIQNFNILNIFIQLGLWIGLFLAVNIFLWRKGIKSYNSESN